METGLERFAHYKKIAIMGGTFDPIHYGHLVTAEAVRDVYGVDLVLFVPSGTPPHKNANNVSSSEHRYLMTVLATVSNPRFHASRIEIDRPGETFTIDTIMQLKEACRPDLEIYFITGADAIFDIFTWKSAPKLFELCQFVAVTRPGYNKETLESHISELNEQFKSRLTLLEVPALSISSTDIRTRVAHNKTIKYLLPEAVETYISKHELYKDYSPLVFDKEKMLTTLKGLIGEYRIKHTLGVVGEAVTLAKAHGINTDKAYVAALLHDCAKEIPPELRKKLCKQYDIDFSEMDVVHSLLGAELAKTNFAITDEDILNAIRFHTTGRKKMSMLEKIVFLADVVEPGRNNAEQTAKIKQTAQLDINKAMVLALEFKLANCKKQGQNFHPLGESALKYYKKLVLKNRSGKIG